MSDKKVAIVGGGIGGLATAALLAKSGYEVSLFEKNNTFGGRCNRFEAEGFFFDTGPSWYLMPPAFDNLFSLLDERIEDYLQLVPLAPCYRAFYDTLPEPIDFFADTEKNEAQFERLEPGVSGRVRRYLALAQARYRFCEQYVFHEAKDGFLHYTHLLLRRGAPSLSLFTSMQREVSHVTKTKELQAALLLPSAFLGGSPWRTPALFSFLSHTIFDHGVLYPQGGMYKIVEALVTIGTKHGVKYHTNTAVQDIRMQKEGGELVLESGSRVQADIVICNTDREYARTHLLHRLTWRQKILRARKPAFSTALIFLGIGRKVPEMHHHNLFFTEHWDKASRDIEKGIIPEDPLFYVSMPSVTDPSCAPEGAENLFILIPVPASLTLAQSELDRCVDRVLQKLSARTSFRESDILFQRRWYPQDFADKYNTPHGSALGLAQSFFQSGLFRPRHRDERSSDLYYVGSTTNPGIGVPTCLLSAEQVWRTITAI